MLYGSLFSRGCQDTSDGFDGADITYFKKDNSSENYTVHEIQIYPLSGGVSWGRGQFPRPLLGWKNINLDKLKVTADDALQIAEDIGGKQARQKINNACEIHILLKPNEDDDKWHIIYFPNNGNPPIFEATINPKIGTYKIFNPGQ
jgi:hypothetical protein